MTSHTCDFQRHDLLRLVGLPLVPVVLFSALLHLGVATKLLPKPRPTLDVDRTILVQKVEAAQARQDADVVLVGDSSCLMDVAARPLGQRLGCRTLNLGTLSYLDLNAYAALLREYSAANPTAPRAVVVLLHPEALRRPAPEAYHLKLLQSLLAGDEPAPRSTLGDRVSHALGLEILRGRVLSRLIPTPLPGPYGRAYGFSDNLLDYLRQNRGSLVDPDPQPFKGDADYRLMPQLEAGSRALRATVPRGTKLLVGITPAPEGFVRAGYAATRDRMLEQWSQWLGADAALQGLPATMPDRLFAKTTHLNAEGASFYTEVMARVCELYVKRNGN